MADYNFEKLSDSEFEDFANALCMKYISTGTNIFGSGTDGGREATYRGRMTYPLNTVESGQWNGYLVVQCKQKRKLSSTLKQDADWAIGQLDEEMKMYEDAVVEREKPEYFLFITNVELSAKLKTGGMDRFLTRLDYWKTKFGMKGVGVWDRNKLGNLLSGSQEIACRYGQLLPGDLIHAVTKFFLAQRTDIKTALSLFLQDELLEDQFVNLKQAGQKTDDAPLLSRVFVDLRANGRDKDNRQVTVQAVDAIQWASDRSVAPSCLDYERKVAVEELGTIEKPGYYAEEDSDVFIPVLTANQEKILRWRRPSRFVIVGGPGQGKSTIAQYLAQRHRAALLSSGVFTIADKTKEAISTIRKEAEETECGLPKHPRLPFRIILEKFANDLANGTVASVMDYIVLLVQQNSSSPFTRPDAEQVLKEMPLLIAFDGLDEVPAVSNRQELLRAIRRFITEVATKDADVLIVATTRPQGYGKEFDSDEYTHLALTPLLTREALHYAKKLLEAKFPNRKNTQRDMLQRLQAAAAEKAIERLMESPLQVTIMAILVETLQRLPQERFALFEEYYDIIYKRELTRSAKLAGMLHKYRSRMEVLHDRIGLRLQVEGETKAGTDGKTTRQSRISRAEFQKVIYNILEKDGHEGQDLIRLAGEFEQVALERLVFIVQLQADSYGFEVRSLQEFAAARELMREVEYKAVRERLLAMGPIPYWRNTVLFAIGQVFNRGDAYRDMLGQLYVELNNNETELILSRTLAGSRLALDVVEEGVGEAIPTYYKGFLDQALRLLTLPHPELAERLGALYEPAYEERFRSATLAAFAVGGAGVQIGPLSLLIKLIAHKRQVEWAHLLLQERWPAKLEEAQALLEQVAEKLTWEPWQLKMVEEVARQSSIVWVMRHLSRRVNGKIAWVDIADKINRTQGEASFHAQRAEENEAKGHVPEKFSFRYTPGEYYTSEVVDILAEAKPTHAEWLPYLLCRDFLLQPSSTTLADAIEALLASPTYVHRNIYIHGLPWQLHLVLNGTDSVAEALAIAQRARRGELGSTQEWKEAEERWTREGFTIADLQAFSNESWPFTAEIATRGIQPMGVYSTGYGKTANTTTAKGLLKAFMSATCARAQFGLAAAFLFSRELTHNREALFSVPLTTVADLVHSSDWKVEGPTVLTLLEPELDWLTNVNLLDTLGKKIAIQRQSIHREEALTTEAEVDTLLANARLLLTIKPAKEGLLRFLASVLVMHVQRVDEATLPLNMDTLSLHGQVALTTLHLLSKATPMPVEQLKQHVLRLWSVLGPAGREAEMPDTIAALTTRERLLKHTADLLSQLIGCEVVDIESKIKIINALMNQTQHLESGFGTEECKKELKIAA